MTMTPRVEDSRTWMRLACLSSSSPLELIASLLSAFTGFFEPKRLRRMIPAWSAANIKLRREWLKLLGFDARKFSNAAVRAMKLIEVPCTGWSRCRPDLAIVSPGLRVHVHVIIEGKCRALAQLNRVGLRAFGVAEADLPSQLIDGAWNGTIDQLTVYRWAPEHVYPANWDVSTATFVFLSPGNAYSIPEGWVGADAEAMYTLLLKAAERTGRDVFVEAVAAYIAPGRSFNWKGLTALGKIRSYYSFSEARSQSVWRHELRMVYVLGVPFGLHMRSPNGWMPVGFDGTELDPAKLAASDRATYAAALESHGGRAGWVRCTFPACGAPPEDVCGHVDKFGWRMDQRPPQPESVNPRLTG